SGISIFNSNLFSVANNLVDVALNGMFLDSNGGGNSVTDNNVRNTSIGIHNLNTDATGFASNTISNNGTGVLVEDSDDVTFLGDNILANTTGMQLDNSDNTFIDSVDFTGNTTHLFISNGSGGTLVTNTDFAGGDTGVLIDGAGSSMQFAGNTSTFTGQNFYFILQNGAMVGDTLDASQQFFEGIRAADFTLAERDAAEARTLDTEDGIVTIGNVFYKDFPAPPPVTFNFNGAGLDEFQQREDDVFPQGLFSYAGQTLTNDITENQQNFRMQQLDLSLLGEGGINDVPTSPPGGVELANLTPEQMANLTPAAGGTSSGEPQQIAELSPSAGGNCGNSFLGAGYEVGFSNVTCSTTEVQ
ncbi:MAG: right-handed parallel beta-helix repeat-containing protein, partial [Alphaproteobacteria bacterium]